MGTKQDIRKSMRRLRAEMSESERAEAGRVIAARLFSSSIYRDARIVCCYVSFGEEVPTKEILEESLRRGKHVAVPRVTGKRNMEFALIRSMSDLAPGCYNLPEPGAWCPKVSKGEQEMLMIVPGIAFDRYGGRIGYGGGYYDSYLEDADCVKAAIAFDLQCVEKIESDVHDVRVDYIITEKEMITCHQDCRKIR